MMTYQYDMNLLREIHMRLFHKCRYGNSTQREYMEMYTNKWIIYNQARCKCGKHREVKFCGTLELADIPYWALNAKH